MPLVSGRVTFVT